MKCPLVKGLVQGDWRELALRELGQRTFVLNFQGAKVAMDVELPSCDLESAWRILWVLYGDYGACAVVRLRNQGPVQ